MQPDEPAEPTTRPAISVRDVAKTYSGDVTAVHPLNLTLARGGFLGLLGPNGAGKSTLIRMITGLVRMDQGAISVFGHDVQTDPIEARRRIGLSPQEPNLDRFLTVRETLIYHGGYFGLRRRRARERADELIDMFRLADKAHERTPRLSGGMRRRLLLARAFLHDPPLLILDEPTAGVDVELRHELWTIIRRLHGAGRTVLLTTHYLEEADALCDDVAFIRAGEIVAHDRPQALRERFRATRMEDVYMQLMHDGPHDA